MAIVNTQFERKYGWEPVKRVEKIRSEEATSTDLYPIQFKNDTVKLKIIKIPIELPIYRLKNGRTTSLQQEYIATHPGTPEDYFQIDEESVEVHEIQHELLLRLVKRTELDKYFEKPTNRQTQPIICTPRGVIVNGNRRISCWRELYYNNPVQYSHFKYIDMAILPSEDEDAIFDLESDLQIAPEMKENYTWHAEAMMMKKRRDELNESIPVIRERFKKKKDSEVIEAIDMLDFAEEYLRRNDFPKQWSKVDDMKFHFSALVNQRKKFSDQSDKEIFKGLAYAIMHNNNEGITYRKINDVQKFYNPIVEAIAEEVIDEYTTSNNGEGTEVDILLLGGASQIVNPNTVSLLNVVNDRSKETTIADLINNVIDEQLELTREVKTASFVFNQVKKANASLQGALSVDLSDQSLISTGVKNQLESIKDCVKRLEEWVVQREAIN